MTVCDFGGLHPRPFVPFSLRFAQAATIAELRFGFGVCWPGLRTCEGDMVDGSPDDSLRGLPRPRFANGVPSAWGIAAGAGVSGSREPSSKVVEAVVGLMLLELSPGGIEAYGVT